MRLPLVTSYGPIGIDLGHASIKAAQLARRGSATALHALACVPRPRPGAALDEPEARALASALSRQGFVNRAWVLAAPGTLGSGGVLELPPRSSGAPVEEIARAELARTLKCEPSSLELGLWELPEPARAPGATPGPCMSMVVACRRDDATVLLEAIELAGHEARAIDAPCLALARAGARLLDAQGVGAIVDLGATGGRCVVLRGRMVVYERPLPDAGLLEAQSRVAQRAGVDELIAGYLLAHADAARGPATGSAASRRNELAVRVIGELGQSLSEELRASLRYASARYADAGGGCVLLTGGGATLPGLGGIIAAGTGCSIKTVRPVDVAPCAPAAAALGGDASLVLACGLSMWEGAA